MKTKKQLTDELAAKDVAAPANANLAALQALAQANGIALDEPEPEKPPGAASDSTPDASNASPAGDPPKEDPPKEDNAESTADVVPEIVPAPPAYEGGALLFTPQMAATVFNPD